MDDCQKASSDFTRCLNVSGRNSFHKCGALGEELKHCGKRIQRDFCVDEKLKVLQCARFVPLNRPCPFLCSFRKPDKRYCSDEFVTLRECNRPTGREIAMVGSTVEAKRLTPHAVQDFNGYTVENHALKLYDAVEMAMPPKRKLGSGFSFGVPGDKTTYRWGFFSRLRRSFPY